MKALFLHADFDPKPGYELDEYERTTHKIKKSNMVWRNPRLEMMDIEKPSTLGPRDVLIHVQACGICGSDLHYIEHTDDGYILYPGHTRLNIVTGHEFSGIIEAVGSAVTEFKVGDYVVPEEMVWCGECIPCRNGYPNQCESLEELGVTINGGFASHVVAPARVCWKIDEMKKVFKDEKELFVAGACVEPSCVAYNGIFPIAGGIRPGAYCAIYGGGPIGLLGTSLLKAAGAAKVIMFEPSEGRREIAKKMGADVVVDSTKFSSVKEQVAYIRDQTEGFGVDFALEAAGVPKITMPVILDSINIGAKIVQTAFAAGETPIYLPELQAKAAKMYGAMGHSGNGTFQNVIRLMAAGMLDPRPMISSRYPLAKGMEAFDEAFKREGAKIMITDMG